MHVGRPLRWKERRTGDVLYRMQQLKMIHGIVQRLAKGGRLCSVQNQLKQLTVGGYCTAQHQTNLNAWQHHPRKRHQQYQCASYRQNSDQSFSTVHAAEPLSRESHQNITSDDGIKRLEEDHEMEGAFEKHDVSLSVVKRLKGLGINYLFPVQYKTLDALKGGQDAIVQARTGTGKTFSFAIPLVDELQRVSDKSRGRAPKVLVLTPTRELARQVSDSFSTISKDLSVLAVYGGTSYREQESALMRGVDVLVGTPGRVMDWLEKGALRLRDLQHVVLDEVDQMLDMGFADDVEKILRHRYLKGDHENNPQTLLFSATMPSWVAATARRYLRPDHKVIDLIGNDRVKAATTVKHLAIQCPSWQRGAMIQHAIREHSGEEGRVIVFCRTKREADQMARTAAAGRRVAALHGDISQNRRESVLKSFRQGSISCLVATDVAARGLDIPEVDLVVQLSPPQDLDMYIHRAGRTGRAGREGTCLLLYTPDERFELNKMEKRAGIRFQKLEGPDTQEVQEVLVKSITRTIDRVPTSRLKLFEATAEELIEKHGALHSLSAALAVAMGTGTEDGSHRTRERHGGSSSHGDRYNRAPSRNHHRPQNKPWNRSRSHFSDEDMDH